MCKRCELKPVYEFTNKRKLCARCFVNYFEKKVLYIIRKFGLIKKGDIIGYKKSNNFKRVVLKNVLKIFSEKARIKLAELRPQARELTGSKLTSSIKLTKIAVDSSLDSESTKIIKILIKGKILDLEKCLPVEGDKIKPLYLFLDEEILLYAKIKKLKFKKIKEKKDIMKEFLDKIERKHPEVKRAIVNCVLELYRKN